jgi:hypothetical protein
MDCRRVLAVCCVSSIGRRVGSRNDASVRSGNIKCRAIPCRSPRPSDRASFSSALASYRDRPCAWRADRPHAHQCDLARHTDAMRRVINRDCSLTRSPSIFNDQALWPAPPRTGGSRCIKSTATIAGNSSNSNLPISSTPTWRRGPSFPAAADEFVVQSGHRGQRRYISRRRHTRQRRGRLATRFLRSSRSSGVSNLRNSVAVRNFAANSSVNAWTRASLSTTSRSRLARSSSRAIRAEGARSSPMCRTFAIRLANSAFCSSTAASVRLAAS